MPGDIVSLSIRPSSMNGLVRTGQLVRAAAWRCARRFALDRAADSRFRTIRARSASSNTSSKHTRARVRAPEEGADDIPRPRPASCVPTGRPAPPSATARDPHKPDRAATTGRRPPTAAGPTRSPSGSTAARPSTSAARRATTDWLESSVKIVEVISGGGDGSEEVPRAAFSYPPAIWDSAAQPNCPTKRWTSEKNDPWGERRTARDLLAACLPRSSRTCATVT